MMTGITIVIPTHGAGSHLMSVLSGLVDQTNRDFEVIVVDNNSCARLSCSTLRFKDLGAVVLHEPRNGLTHARNAGVACARGSCVAFLDDDAVPTSTWIQNLVDGLRRYGSAAVGGSVQLNLPCETPPWIGAAERALLSELLYSGRDIPVLGDDMYIVGANMCITRDAFDRVGFFAPGFGRTATSLRSSEELEFTRRLQVAGQRVSFIASARVHHHIDAYRLTEHYLLSRAYWQGRSDALLEARWGRPASFGHRGWGVNLMALCGRLRDFVFEDNAAARIRRRLSLAREYGYCLQVALLRFHPPSPSLKEHESHRSLLG
jgi:glucosyl-dolichyl phosphate glucuronosyltransferase